MARNSVSTRESSKPSNVAANGDDDPGLIFHNKLLHEASVLLAGYAAIEKKHAVAELPQPNGEVINMLRPSRRQQGRGTSTECRHNIANDLSVPC
jgi:hypothetical protein